MAYDRIFRRCYTLLIFILFSALYSTAADWLCFTAETATARLWCNEYAEKLNVEYSLDDGQTWQPIPTSSSNNNYPSDGAAPDDAITLRKGEKVYVRGLYDGARFSGTDNVTFGMSGEMAVTGNVMSLVDGEGKATEIPTDNCFCALFRYCYGLTHAPELPATVLTRGCYLDMFYKCSKLTEAPALPATELKYDCYRSMFRDCTGLTKAPDLMAYEMVNRCYYRMFDGCSNLNYIKVGTPDLRDGSEGWLLRGPSGSGTFLLPCGSVYTARGSSGIPNNFTIEYYAVVVFMNADKTELQRDTLACGELPTYRGKTPTLNGKTAIGWDKEIVSTTEPVEYYTANYDPVLPEHCLCLTAVEAGSTVSYANINNSPDVQYTIDGGYTWSTLNEGQKVTLKDVGDKVYIRGYNPEGFSKNANSYTRLVLQGDIAASGSVMSLIDGKGDVTEIPSTCCFLDLFLGCKALTKAPELTATVLNDSCYWSMFDNCTSLTEAPELPVKELKQNCYDKMFYGCSALTKAPELPATKMEAGCYEKMFYGCSSLTKAPELPATQLAERCYNEMFLGCKNLTEAPELPATTLETGCYRGMFSNCASLTEAPKLMAGSLTKDCYRNMFENCSSLNYIEVGVMTLDNNFNATSNWVKGVDGPGLFVFPCGSKYDKHGSSEVPTNFTIKSSPIVIFQYDNGDELYRDTINCGDIPVYKGETPYKEHSLFKGWDKALDVINDPDVYYYTAIFEEMDDWLCFTAEEDGSVFWYENKGENEPNVQYSEDGGYTWKKLLADERVTISKKGEKVYLRGNNPKGFSHSADNRSVFSMKGHIAASGTVMSLIDEKGVTTKIPSSHCFRGLFEGCADLTQAPKLTATELASSCYASMFGRCTGLTEAPELPATEMASSCYYYMFTGCTNIKEAPKLPATKLATACYFCMFIRCTSLTETPELPLTELKTSCYQGMFQECTSLTKAPELPAVVMEKNCYTDMFHGCTSLVKAPSLPATTLAESCYHNLFYGCTSLTDAPELPATELAVDCYNSMFEGCTSLTEAPKLMALTFAENCYEEMFKGCSSLNYIEVGVMTLDNDVNATLNWVDGVDGPGLFVFPCGSKYDKHGVSEVPTDFTIKASPIVVFLNQDDTELYRDTIGCDVMPEYRGETPTMGDDYEFVGWDPELTIHEKPGTYYYKALYEEVVPVEGKWLCFTSEEAGSEIWYVNGAQNLPKMQYSFNGVKWYDWQEDEHILFKYEDLKIYVRGDNPDGFSHDNSSNDANGTGATNTRFKMSGRIAASGSVMSLIDGEGTSTKIPCDFCFSDLFRDCDALTKAPELPATELAPNCYALMFQGCTNLTNVPELPATELATKCYISMFLNCSSLVDVPATLPATKLERGCYWGMFGYCSSLIKSPELPATELAPRCYNSMFIGCESLTDVPELPATELKDSCYFNMFSGCTSIVKAPELLATSLMDGCYSGMFNGCTSLNYIKVGVMTLDNNFDATKDWVEGIDGEGLFIFPCGSKYDKHGQSEVPTNFTIVSSPIVVFLNANEEELYRDTIGCDVLPEYRGETPTMGDGSVFVGWDPELTIHEKPGTYYYKALYEAPVEGNWLCFTAEQAGSSVWYVNGAGNKPKVQYSFNGRDWADWPAQTTITLANKNDKVYVRGDNPDGFSHETLNVAEVNVNNRKCTYFQMKGTIAASGSVMSLIDGEGITTDIPCNYCFNHLFIDCTSLTTPPGLPALELKSGCYDGMFLRCRNLRETPQLPATKLAQFCYGNMFAYCSNLTEAPELPATTIESSCYTNMLAGTSITEAPELPATEMKYGCYSSMFAFCKNLTKAPELPATQLANACYRSMFSGCTSLTTAPELLATQLDEECYMEMFNGCTSLNYIKVGVMTLDNNFDATKDWVEGIDGEGLFIFPCGSKYDKHGQSEVPTNFTIVSSPIVVFLNANEEELYRDTIGCDVLPEYKGETPTLGDGSVFVGWSPELTIHEKPGTYYYTALYEGAAPVEGKWLCFTAEEAGSTVRFRNVNNNPDIHYSLDNGKTWLPWNETNTLILKEEGDKVYVKGINPDGFSHTIGQTISSGDNTSNIHNTGFILTGRIAASGSLMSLIDGVGDADVIPCDYCFSYLFAGNDALVTAPDLTATTLKKYCYLGTFRECSNLIQASELPATQMEYGCYAGLYYNCSSLTTAPALPATQLATYCYNGMFGGCSGLTSAPELPATTLQEYCYTKMFVNCTGLTKAPELPVTSLVASCYNGMFMGCTNLVKAPELPADKLAEKCYMEMFKGCTSLNYIKVGVMTLDNDFDATKDWVEGIDGEGLFIFPCGSKYDKHGQSEVPTNFTIVSSPIVVFLNANEEELYRDTIGCDVLPEYKGETPTLGDGSVFVGWSPELTIHEKPGTYYYTALYEGAAPVEGKWLCFTAEENGSEVWYVSNRKGSVPDMKYSFDGVKWYDWTVGDRVTLANVGDKVYVKGNNPNGFSQVGNTSQFEMTGTIAVSGNVMSLIDEEGITTEIPCANCFEELFLGCPITTAPELPALTLKESCYYKMFFECEKLKKTPELPATQLEKFCYRQMFQRCSSIASTPELPATELTNGCYLSMFSDCDNLSVISPLPASVMKPLCYSGMFSGCTSILEAPELSAMELERSCYESMFYECKNLKKAPALPATQLKDGCYLQMFAGCVSLTEAADLHFKEFADVSCYLMFNGCTSLNYVKVDVMTLDNDFNATDRWVDGIDGKGLFVFPCGSKYDKHGISEVPMNFTIVSSPIVVFQNQDGTELYRDTIGCDVLPEYRGETPTLGDGSVFVGWDPELTIHDTPGTYYYTALYDGAAPVEGDWLCFTAEKDKSYFFYVNKEDNNPDVQYSTDGGKTWKPLQALEEVPLAKAGEKVYVKGNNPNGFSRAEEVFTYFDMVGAVSASGSVMSLIDGEGKTTEIPNDFCFTRLFLNATALTQAPKLTALSLKTSCYDEMFSGCFGLTTTPDLPATKLAESCYNGMFLNCKNIVSSTAILPATQLADRCYTNMFFNCQSLTTAPVLPATELTESCYASMFHGCSSLVDAPELPAMKLAAGCYGAMFGNCESLQEAPVLPATELAWYCYAGMFSQCSNLVVAPELPAISMEPGCYSDMFSGCTSLEEAPELPAPGFATECYAMMFNGCTSLNYIKVGVMSLDNDLEATNYWVNGIDGPGKFIFPCGSKYNKHGSSEVPTNFEIIASPIIIFLDYDDVELYRDTIGCDVVAAYKAATPTREGYEFIGWDKELTIHDTPGVYYYKAVYKKMGDPIVGDWLCFTAEEEELTVWYESRGGVQPDLQYSVDGGLTWNALDALEEVKVLRGEKIYLRGDNPKGFSTKDAYVNFHSFGTFSASGSVMSLVDGQGASLEIPNDYCFNGLFSSCVHLLSVPELPATTLTEGCYQNMFEGCSLLVDAPALPAETMQKSCYKGMFDGCVNLTSVPQLPATELAEACYQEMFRRCEKVTKAPELPATTVKADCYNGMFEGCRSLLDVPALPSTTMAVGCYANMFSNCSSLTQAPELPALELADRCYHSMFADCKELAKAPVLPAVTMANSCYVAMFLGCTALTEASELPATTLADSCYYIMFSACSNLTKAPVLPATNLAPHCYSQMFNVCTKLEEVPELAALSFADQACFLMFNGCSNLNYIRVDCMTLDNDVAATKAWVSGVDGEGLFVFPCGSKYDKHGISEVPINFTIQSSPIVIFQNPDSTELYRDTIPCDVVAEYRGETPTYGDSLVFIGWDKELTIHEVPGTYYYTALYKSLDDNYVLRDSVISACDSFFVDGRLLRENTLWRDTLVSDSLIITYHLRLSHSVERDSFLSACESITLNGVTYRESTLLSDTLVASTGCDSVVNYHLTILHGVVKDTTIIAEDQFVWNEVTYTEDASWNDTLQSVAGCDSLVRYTLIIQKNPEENYVLRDSVISACDSFFIDGRLLKENTEWKDTLVSDSIVITYHLQLSHSVERDSFISACESFTLNGDLYRESALFSDTLISSTGCDSVVNYHLTILHGVVKDTTIIAEDQFVWNGVTYTEDASWNDTLQSVAGCDSLVRYTLIIHKNPEENYVLRDSVISACDSFFVDGRLLKENTEWKDTLVSDSIVITYHLQLSHSVERDSFISACDSLSFKGTIYRESALLSDTLISTAGCDSVVNYHLIVHHGVVKDTTIIAEEQFVWEGVTYTDDAFWNDTLQSVAGCDSIVMYNLVVNKHSQLTLNVDDDLILVLPGGTEPIGYELLGGTGSTYEIKYEGNTICSGTVDNDSTVLLDCPTDLEPGAYEATMVMYDGKEGSAERKFLFNVMLPDIKENSYYVRVWNDVVICRNGDGLFETFQWYKDREVLESETLQHYNDLTLLNGEYMVYVSDKYGKSYFIEPVLFGEEKAAYSLTATPALVDRGSDFVLTVSGVDSDEMENARIVVYRTDGTVMRVVDTVREENTMRLWSGDYVIMLTVNDGKVAYCKVLVK